MLFYLMSFYLLFFYLYVFSVLLFLCLKNELHPISKLFTPLCLLR